MRQLELLSPAPATTATPELDPTFAGAVRRELADGAWVEHVPGWITAHDALFAALERGLAWRHETRKMYERTVDVPRLLASIPDDDGAGDGSRAPGQPLLARMRDELSARYGEVFVRTTAALYRDGNDSVAWHGDTTARDLPSALVATVSLGAPRRFLMKPTAGGASIAWRAGLGDLIVMGGSAQRTWRHAIPKVAHAAPRIAVMFRPAWGAAYDVPSVR